MTKSKLSFDEKKAVVRDALSSAHKSGSVYIHPEGLWDDEVAYDHDTAGSSKTYKRSYSIDGDTQAVTLGDPVEVRQRKVYEPVVQLAPFSQADFSEDGDWVIRRGKVGEVGRWDDKEFSLTEQEADSAIANFKPVSNDSQHGKSIFDGKLGKLEKLWRQGKDILGEVRIPRWLHQVVGPDNPIKTSLSWRRTDKQIVGNALVVGGRIADAQLVAAFSMLQTSVGEVPEDDCAGPKGTFPIRNAEDLIHVAELLHHADDPSAVKAKAEEIADRLGLTLPSTWKRTAKKSKAKFSESRKWPTMKKLFAMIGQLVAGKITTADFNEALEELPEDGEVLKEARFTAANDPEFKRLAAENERLKAEKDAVSVSNFSAEIKASDKVWPLSEPYLAALFSQIAKDDSAETVNFSVGDKQFGSRSELLRKYLDSLPAIHMGKEVLPTDPKELEKLSVKFSTAGKPEKAQEPKADDIYKRRRNEARGIEAK